MIIFDKSACTLLTSGGEGDIYDYNNRILKIFKPGVDITEKRKKIDWLIYKRKSKSIHSRICCPMDLVSDPVTKQVIGYAMPRINGEDISKLSSKKFCKLRKIDNKKVDAIMKEVAEILTWCHTQGVVIGDLNEGAIMLDDHDLRPWMMDCDSWSIPGCAKCMVGMEGFVDPQLQQTGVFTKETDDYSFGIISWKGYTRVHPFGGTTTPSVSLLDRMKMQVSVLDDNANIKLPPTLKPWNWMDPDLIAQYKDVFNIGKRGKIIPAISSGMKLTQCGKCKEYYSVRYSSCPLCDATAKLRATTPSKVPGATGIKLTALYPEKSFDVFLNLNIAVDTNGLVVNLREMSYYGVYTPGLKYDSIRGQSGIGSISAMIVDHGAFVSLNDKFIGAKQFGTPVITGDDYFYYQYGGKLHEAYLTPGGIVDTSICNITRNAYFNVLDRDTYCIVNILGKNILIDAKSHKKTCSTMIPYDHRIDGYGIHYDQNSLRWWVILRSNLGEFTTFMLEEKPYGLNVVDNPIDSSVIPSYVDPGNIAVFNNTIFWPDNQKIVGYNTIKQIQKDFACDIVSPESVLHRGCKHSGKFMIQNLDNLYLFG